MESLNIEKYRGLKDLQLDGLRGVNLILGKNGTGKTSILEALWLMNGGFSTDHLERIEMFRNLRPNQIADYATFFPGFDFAEPIELEGIVSNKKLGLTIKKGTTMHNDGVHSMEYDAITMEFNWSRKKYVSRLIYAMQPTPVGQTVAPLFSQSKLPLKIGAHFLSTNERKGRNSDCIQHLIQEGRLDELTTYVSKLIPSVTQIDYGQSGLLCKVKGAARLAPVETLGYGALTVITVISTLLATPNQMVLIDEVENGIHYRFYQFLWETIFSIAKDKNVQVVVTTHSKDVLEGLAEVLGENSGFHDDFAQYSLVRTDEAVHAFRREAQAFIDNSDPVDGNEMR